MKVLPLIFTHKISYFSEISLMASCEIIQTNNQLIQAKQRLKKIATDKPCNTSY